MRNLLFVLLAVLLMSCASTQQGTITRGTVVEYPEVKSNENEAIEVMKIELTDDATILHVEVYNAPRNWIAISSKTVLRDRDGRTYKLLSSKGFELDRRIPMPRSGKKAFALYFEPVNKDVKEVKYIEGDGYNDFRIFGIKLYEECYKANTK